MTSPVRPCLVCRALVPQLSIDTEAFDVIVNALSGGSPGIATLELKHSASCSEKEASSWISHLLSCAAAWPTHEEDEEVLRKISEAFSEVKKPEHFTNFTHCDECKEHDDTLRARTRETLQRQDLGNAGWDPISFCGGEGIGYLFPTLARFSLLPSVWRDYGWYGAQLLSHLSYHGAENKFLIWCSPAQREAVTELLNHILKTRSEAVSQYGYDDELLNALHAWGESA